MKICIIFRGEHIRNNDLKNKGRNYVDILLCWNNLKYSIYNDIINNNNECDIALITYDSYMIEQIKNIINPKYIVLNTQINQTTNFNNVITFIDNHKNNYDRFVIIRCDIIYRIPITKWNNWDKTGIILVNKDVHWPKQKLYSDILFIVDSNYIDIFKNAYYLSIVGTDHIHKLGYYLYINNISFYLIYDDYYHNGFHPLFSMLSIHHDNIDLNNSLHIEPLKNISEWNI
jgi:hypothetical protein